MAEYTKFGVEVKTKLIMLPQTQKWLCDEVSKDTGLSVDNPYMSRILTGQRTPAKVIDSICKILDIQKP